MPGTKRSARQTAVLEKSKAGTTPRPETKPKREVARVTGELRSVLCPVCGRSAGKKRLKYPYGAVENGTATENYWEKTKDFDPNKPFGVIQEVGGGRGHSFRVIGYFNPDDDPDGYFPLVKARLLKAVDEWLKKGWISEQEVLSLVRPVQP